jgi:hypothetical protein
VAQTGKKRAKTTGIGRGKGVRRKRRKRNPVTGELEFPPEKIVADEEDEADAVAGAEDGEDADGNANGQGEGEVEEEEEEDIDLDGDDEVANIAVPADRAIQISSLTSSTAASGGQCLEQTCSSRNVPSLPSP